MTKDDKIEVMVDYWIDDSDMQTICEYDKIEVMVDYWIDDSDMQTICEYAATKLTENYNLLSIEKVDDYYEEFLNEDQQL